MMINMYTVADIRSIFQQGDLYKTEQLVFSNLQCLLLKATKWAVLRNNNLLSSKAMNADLWPK